MRAEAVEIGADPRVLQPPIIRIRTVLAILLLGTLGYKVYPRAQAAWQLHGLATAVADYALCMVGPTGPSLIRDNPDEFGVLVRRRLVSSLASERPFAECAELASQVTGSETIAGAHQLAAAEFTEFGTTNSRAERRLEELRVTTEPLAEMSRRAWPFVRGGYTRLVKASISASEAVHPVAPPEPAVGSGLPDWRARYRAVRRTQTGFVLAQGQGANLALYETKDAGVSWKPVSSRQQPSDFMERCPIDADGRSFTFSLSDDGSSTVVNSLGPDGAPYATVLSSSDVDVLAAACDADGLVVALRSGPGVHLKLCPFRRGCSRLRLSVEGAQLSQVTDVARIAGTTVVAFAAGGIVRVTSSRDAGRSWTPLSVAYDAGEARSVSMGLKAPTRLLTLADRLLLYGGAQRRDQAYLVLVSDDHGASWRTP